MAVDPKLAGSEFLRETLTLLPAEKRPALEALLTDADAAAALTRLGEGTLRQSDYDRQMNLAKKAETDGKTLYESNRAWFEEHKAGLTELDSLRARMAAGEVLAKPGEPGDGQPAKLPANVVTKEQMDTFERDAIGFVSDLSALNLRHYVDFGEVLDTRAILADKRVQQIGIQGVYNEMYRDKITAKAEGAKKAAEEVIRKDEREKVLAASNGQHIPYAVRGNEPSTLDGIEAAAGKPVVGKSPDEMASEYARLGAARSA